MSGVHTETELLFPSIFTVTEETLGCLFRRDAIDNDAIGVIIMTMQVQGNGSYMLKTGA